MASQMNLDRGNGGGGGVHGGEGSGGFTSGSNRDGGRLHAALPTAAWRERSFDLSDCSARLRMIGLMSAAGSCSEVVFSAMYCTSTAIC